MTNETNKPATNTPSEKSTPKVGEKTIRLNRQFQYGKRTFFINVLLMFLVAIAVYAIAAFFFIFPRIVRNTMDIQQIKNYIEDTQREVKSNTQAISLLIKNHENISQAVEQAKK